MLMVNCWSAWLQLPTYQISFDWFGRVWTIPTYSYFPIIVLWMSIGSMSFKYLFVLWTQQGIKKSFGLMTSCSIEFIGNLLGLSIPNPSLVTLDRPLIFRNCAADTSSSRFSSRHWVLPQYINSTRHFNTLNLIFSMISGSPVCFCKTSWDKVLINVRPVSHQSGEKRRRGCATKLAMVISTNAEICDAERCELCVAEIIWAVRSVNKRSNDVGAGWMRRVKKLDCRHLRSAAPLVRSLHKILWKISLLPAWSISTEANRETWN